jgi:hypothetical protein
MGRPKLPPNPNENSKQRWQYNRLRQLARGAEWNLSHKDWHDFWLKHGIDKNTDWMPNDDKTLCLYRKDESKPFQKGNLKLESKSYGMKGKLKPRAWIHKDPEVHKRFDPWHKARAQAHYRKEEWTLTFEEFCDLWTDELWAQRGRASHEMAMTRDDPDGAWSKDNAIIIPRKEQLTRAHMHRLDRGQYGPRNKR